MFADTIGQLAGFRIWRRTLSAQSADILSSKQCHGKMRWWWSRSTIREVLAAQQTSRLSRPYGNQPPDLVAVKLKGIVWCAGEMCVGQRVVRKAWSRSVEDGFRPASSFLAALYQPPRPLLRYLSSHTLPVSVLLLVSVLQSQ